jgi:succinyl-CoA synthetase beta subunit
MNIHEYQAKELLRSYGIPVPNGEVIHNPEEAEKASWRIGTDIAVVKAQIHAGGRGKAGGVKIAKSIDEVKEYSKELLGKKLVTHQTGEEGKEVKTVLIEEGCEIHKEYYLGFVLDRDKSSITIIASEEGGTEIEEVALKSPDKIYKETIDYLIGLTEFQARRICFNINLPLEIINNSVKFMMNLYQLFVEKDCTQVEINPLVLTKERKLIALDAKINFDENGLFRNKDISNYRDLSEEDEREIEASKHGLSYISLDGNIGCVVNGAGLAMATMDLIKFYGGEPANFLDVGGGATEENVTNAFKIILLDPRVKGIFVNIFGGIMKCDVMAKGIVNAAKELQLDIPLVIRLEGTNADLGMEIIKSSSFNIFAAKDMDEGAKKILELIK